MARKRSSEPPKNSDPPKIISRGVVEVRYQHVQDDHFYVHRFASGECVAESLADGSIRLFNPRGAPLWGEF